ncbi:unnamed protein product [Brassica rapa subsp. trilocularis]
MGDYDSIKSFATELREMFQDLQAMILELEKKKRKQAVLDMETFARAHEETRKQTNTTKEKLYEENVEELQKEESLPLYETSTIKSDALIVTRLEKSNHEAKNDLGGRQIPKVNKTSSRTFRKIWSCQIHITEGIMIRDYG